MTECYYRIFSPTKYINYQYKKLGDYELVTNNLIKILKKKYEIRKKEK